MSNGHSDGVDHINSFTDAEYNEWLDVQNEAAYWEAMHRQIDEVMFLTGRISRRIDEASEILATIPATKNTKRWTGPIPF